MTLKTNVLFEKAQRKALAGVRRLRNRITSRPVMVYGSNNLNHQTMEFLKKNAQNCQIIAEIGVDRGSTSEAILRWLGGKGTIHLFDYEDRVRPITERLRQTGFYNYFFHADFQAVLDSYNWSLMKLMRDGNPPNFDYVYLDGSHTWGIDALAFYLIDKMLRPGGYIDFDGYDWTISASPSINPRVYPASRRLFTQEQMDTPQVKLVIEILVRRDGRYEEVLANKVFRKLR